MIVGGVELNLFNVVWGFCVELVDLSMLICLAG